MAYGVVQFIENGARKVTLVRERGGEPTGAEGLMNLLSAFVEESSPAILREGSPGAVRMAMAFLARELEAGRELRVLGADDERGITAEEIKGLPGAGYYYEVQFGGPGERSVPQILSHGIPKREAS